jgi:hypothetical protein
MVAAHPDKPTAEATRVEYAESEAGVTSSRRCRRRWTSFATDHGYEAHHIAHLNMAGQDSSRTRARLAHCLKGLPRAAPAGTWQFPPKRRISGLDYSCIYM